MILTAISSLESARRKFFMNSTYIMSNMLCKFKSLSLFISLEIDSFYSP